MRGLQLGLAFAFITLASANTAAQGIDVQGQLSAWFILNDETPSTPTLGIRYLPALMLERPLGHERLLDVEVSVNGYASASAPDWQDVSGTSVGKAYRVWARFKTSRFETRVGLQKINFGSATLLRPLMWFDSVDPRDPLQITDGVYAVLLRYFLPNDATIWTWGLYGNTRRRGWETSPSVRRTPEVGGRLQLPAGPGEFAFTTHHRRSALGETFRDTDFAFGDTPERRYALDGKWDVGIGVWFEGVVSRQQPPGLGDFDQEALNVGADYTFALGNGLHVLGEYFVLEQSFGALAEDRSSRLGALSVRYPVSLLDTLSGIVYVDELQRDWYRFVSWQRTYDRWQLYVMGFWNPRQSTLLPGAEFESVGRSPMSGRGFQLMVVFNH
jgi:hypothetical protein